MKNYRFTYDAQTGLYSGLAYDVVAPFEHTTDIEPHFRYGFKTVFDVVMGDWKLVPSELFFEHAALIDKMNDADMFFMSSLKDFSDQLSDFKKISDSFDMNNADRFIALKTEFEKRFIKMADRLDDLCACLSLLTDRTNLIIKVQRRNSWWARFSDFIMRRRHVGF